MIMPIKLINIGITSHNNLYVHVCMWWEQLRSLSGFQVYNTVLLTGLYIAFQNLFILLVKMCTLWPIYLHLSYLPIPGKHHSTLFLSICVF